jgi:ATP-dependent helicase HrpB
LSTETLPVEAVLPDVRAALAGAGSAVLIAPPGAGKTTAVAPALLGEAWCSGQIIVTSPRRIAARAAAARMAELLGQKPGETIGYLTRLDSKISARTRILIVTEAILVNRLVEDPELAGVSAILFDEAHERTLDSDLGLALALETRSVLREDLRVLVMSATIDGARFAQLLGEGAPVVESEGRSYPLEIRWLCGDASQRIEDRMVQAVLTAWRETAEDILAFLPGVREIERVCERIGQRLPDTPIHALHGQVEPAAQAAAIRRDPDGRRRIVLATAIAETSLTLDGVGVVVDSGLARLAEFDRAAGTTHLVTRRASQAAATQRAGRAARQGPGVAYRLWEEGGHAGRPAFAPPEILTGDLASLLLRLARRGTGDPGDLAWLDPPPGAAVAAARAALEALGALDGVGRITPLGEAIARLPMAPDHAAAVLHGAAAGVGEAAARLVMLLQERSLGGRGEDLTQRLARWQADRTPRSAAAREVAQGWARQARGLAAAIGASPAADAAETLALARPDFVARRRDASGEHWLSAGGRGYVLDPASPLARAEWIVIGDAQGQARGARITAGAEIAPERIAMVFASELEEQITTRWNNDKNRVEARRERRLGAIILASVPEPAPDPALCVDILVEKALDRLGEILPHGFLARAHFAGVETLAPETLRSRAEGWLVPVLAGRRDLDLPPQRYADAALSLVDWDQRQALDRAAPTHFSSPADTRHVIDYAGDDAPSIEIRVQALFGLDAHPMIGPQHDGVPLLLKLTSPAGRPIQSTRDIAGFWRGSWRDVAKDMKGRYPRHRWPDQPWLERPSLKTKNAFNRSDS